MGAPLVYRDSVYTEQQQITANAASITLPNTIGAGASVAFNTFPITCTPGEFWNLIAGGIDLNFTAAGVVVDAATCALSPGARTQVFNQQPAVTGSSTAIRIPFQEGLILVSAIWLAFTLAGTEMVEGDALQFVITLRNTTGAAIDLTGVGGGVRYRPLKLVSEVQVANLQQARQDFALDQRLRATRG